MSITNAWDNAEKTIIRQTWTDWTWDEYAAASSEHKAMLDTVKHVVDLIVDVKSIIFPKNILSLLPKFAAATSFTHPRAGLVVVMGASPTAAAIGKTFCKVHSLLSRKVFFAPTLEEAHQIIAGYYRR